MFSKVYLQQDLNKLNRNKNANYLVSKIVKSMFLNVICSQLTDHNQNQ